MNEFALNNGLTFLVWTSGAIILVVGVFLVKLLIDLSKLAKNINATSMLLNEELKPTLKALNETLTAVNEIVKSTDRGFDNFKHAMDKIFGKTNSFISAIVKGFTTTFSLFSKK